MRKTNKKHLYAQRTWIRSRLPWFLINLGFATKGKDCEAVNAEHHWYNIDNKTSGCYHCEVTRKGKHW
mgnify:CR=1 FL=1